MSNNGKFRAILELLDDPSGDVSSMMNTQLKKLSIEELTELRVLANRERCDTAFKVDVIIQEKTYEKCIAELSDLLDNDSCDLETMVFFIARFIDSDVKEADLLTRINSLADQCSEFLKKESDLDRDAAFIKFMSEECGFSGNTKNYYAIGNCSLDVLLKSKKALPITISILYILIGRRLSIPVAGIALPGHFVVGVINKNSATYCDPFSNGKLLSEEHCLEIASKTGYSAKGDWLKPADDRSIILRALNNLRNVYSREDKNDEEGVTSIFIKMWTDKAFGCA